MAITVTGATLTVTLTNATDLELGGHLTWSADDTYDVGASGVSRPRTGYFGTSIVTPTWNDVGLASGIFSRAGTLGLSATGTNILTFSTNGGERGRWTSDGNLLIGTTTDDGSSKLQVAGNITRWVTHAINQTGEIRIGSSYTSNFYGLALRYALDGAGSNSQALVSYNAGVIVGKIAMLSSGSVVIGGETNGNYRLDVQSSGSTGTMRVYDQTATTGVTSLVVRAGAGQSTGAMLNILENDGTTSLLRVEPTKIGFFGAAPVVQQVAGAGDAAAIITALKNLGLMAP